VQPRRSSSLAALVDRSLQTRRGNLYLGLGLLALSVALLALVRAFGHLLVGSQGLESLWLPLFMAVVSVPVFAGITMLFGARLGFPNGLRAGVAAYAVLGGLVFVVGIPGHVPALRPPLGPFWPFFVLWFHSCLAGVGLWGCPA